VESGTLPHPAQEVLELLEAMESTPESPGNDARSRSDEVVQDFELTSVHGRAKLTGQGLVLFTGRMHCSALVSVASRAFLSNERSSAAAAPAQLSVGRPVTWISGRMAMSFARAMGKLALVMHLVIELPRTMPTRRYGPPKR